MTQGILTFTDVAALGNAIDAAHPYRAVHAKSLSDDHPPVTVQYAKNNAGYTYETSPKSSSEADANYRLYLGEGIEVANDVGEWKFKGSPHYIKRAIRIPYVYYAPARTEAGDVGTAILTKDYLIIAYEGGGGY